MTGKNCERWFIMPRTVRAEALSDAFVGRLSVAYIGNNSRTERPRKPKLAQVAHVTCDSETTFPSHMLG